MTPWAAAHTLCSSTYLDDDVLADILASGCSRMAVWPAGSPDSVCGILVVKRLLALGPEPGALLNPNHSSSPSASYGLTFLSYLRTAR